MKIEWNRVTWYSKLLAVIVGVLTIWLGFYFWSEFNKIKISSSNKQVSNFINDSIDQREINGSLKAPDYLKVEKDTVVLVKTGGIRKVLATYPGENALIRGVSPSGNYLAVIHYKTEKAETLGMFSYYLYGLDLISLKSDTPEIYTVVPENISAQTDIRWSPDEKYLSYIDQAKDSNSIVLWDFESKQIAGKLEAKKDDYQYFVSPVTFLSNDRISFVLDKDLYVGSISNPKEKLIAKDVITAESSFEGPTYFVEPEWSEDKRYVFYKSTLTDVILDTQTGKYVHFGEMAGPAVGCEFCGNDLNVSSMGWRGNKFFFSVNKLLGIELGVIEQTFSINMPEGTKEQYATPLDESPWVDKDYKFYPENNLYSISKNGQYLFFVGNRVPNEEERRGNSGMPWVIRIYSTNNSVKTPCTIDGTFAPFSYTREGDWVKDGYALLGRDKGFMGGFDTGQRVDILNLQSCKIEGAVFIDLPEDARVLHTADLPSIDDFIKSKDSVDTELTEQKIKNISFLFDGNGEESKTLNFKNGRFDYSFFEGKVVSENDPMIPNTNGYFELRNIHFGDINRDGRNDAVAILGENAGGNGYYAYLVAFVNVDGQPIYRGLVDLGDRIKVNSINIDNGIITLDMIVHGPNSGMCCPDTPKVLKLKFENDRLVQINGDAHTVADGSDWKTYKNEKYGVEFKYPDNLGLGSFQQEPTAIVTPIGSSNINEKGCLVLQEPGVSNSNVTINGNNYCLSKGVDVGAGQAYHVYAYTMKKDSNYITLEYIVHTSNGCGVFKNDEDVNAPGNERYKECQDLFARYDDLVSKPIEDSVASLKFIK